MALRASPSGAADLGHGIDGGASVVKPEWGTKRICPSCGCKFYDMQHTPCVCPKCETKFDPAQTLRGSKKAAAAAAAAEKAKNAKAKAAVAPVAEEMEDAILEGEEVEEEGDEILEDASDLGEDDDDMAEVMEHLDEDGGAEP
jgi:uncharacterized protein (TIGR02300 family)